MMQFILRALAAALGFWLASRLIGGLHVESVISLIEAGVVLGLLNAVVRPILVVLTLPLSIMTLGLFLFVVNGLMVLLVGWVLHQFHDSSYQVHGLIPAILTTVIIWIVSLIGDTLIGGDERRRR